MALEGFIVDKPVTYKQVYLQINLVGIQQYYRVFIHDQHTATN